MNLIALGAFLLLAVAPPSIAIDGAFVKTGTLDASGIAALPHISYSGVRLGALLESAGASVGSKVKGAPARSFVVAHASDGYAAVSSLAELDSTDESCAPV